MTDATDIQNLLARLEQAERRAEDANLRAERERRRAQEADLRAEQERQRAQEADSRAEQERQRAQEADLRAEQERQRTQMTTFEEYIKLCHDNLHYALSVETDKRLTTKGFTNIKNKYYPKRLRPWAEFSETQMSIFSNIHRFFHANDQPVARFFNSEQYIQELAQNLARRKLASEKDLETYQRIAVEDAATSILSTLSAMPKAQAELGLDEKIEFENHANSLSAVAEEVQERLYLHTPRTSPSLSSSSSSSKPSSMSPLSPKRPRTRADQFCVYGESGETRRLLFLIEYKPPHKLSIGNLRAGLRDMDLKKEVFDRIKIPAYKEKPEEQMTPADEDAKQEKLQYNAEKLVAAVVTQTFHTMIEFGLEYGYITTGQAFVFLQIRWEDPRTLFYQLVVPGEEAEGRTQIPLAQTAISQVVSICTMAFQSAQRSHTQRKWAKTQLQKHQIDYEAILREIPETERKQTPSIGYRGRKDPNLKRSPYLFRQRTRSAQKDGTDSSDDSSLNTPSKMQSSSKARSGGKDARVSKDTSGQSSGSKQKDQTKRQTEEDRDSGQYCTQACLLSLARGWPVDNDCPNVELHRPFNHHHTINAAELVDLIQWQLAVDPERGCKPLGLQGARGALFRIALLSHGYVLVAKGTVRAFVSDMSYEASIYEHLQALQGTAIPICFGRFKLRHRYYLDLGVKISYMLLLSWSGEMISGEITESHYEVRKTVQEVLNAGINQGDVRNANLLWNKERRRVMLIDFERAIAVSKPKRSMADADVLQELSLNKKSRHYVTEKVYPMPEALAG